MPGAFFSFAVAAFFMTSIPGGGPALGTWGYAMTGLCVTKAVWFWLFARALFNDDARIGGRHLAIVGAVAAAGTWQQTVFLAQYRAGVASTGETIAGFGIEGTLLLFVLLGLYEAYRGMAIDLVERRRRLRLGFMVAAGVYLFGRLFPFFSLSATAMTTPAAAASCTATPTDLKNVICAGVLRPG